MILGITQFVRWHLFQDGRDAEVSLKAMDVSSGAMEFCDDLIFQVAAESAVTL